MIPTPKLAEIVLSRNAETEATQEKLVALVTRHHEELGQLLEVLPELKREALDNINARLENVIADASARTTAIARGQQAEFAATAEFKMGEKMRVIEPLLASLQATRDEIQTQLAGLGQKHTESLAEITASLKGIAEERARAMLASDETKGLIRAALDEHSKPILAALESKGGNFIDLYQGDFVEGRSSAQRGQIWSYFGNTVLCLKDTVSAPAYLQGANSAWALLAARGANGQPGAAGTGGSGGGIPEAPEDGTPYARQDAGWVTAVPSNISLSQMADLAQDQFIGRTTASTGVPQTATITAAARTVLDDANVAAMVDTLGGASSTGTGGLVRAESPTLSGTVTVTGTGGAVLNNDSASAGAISSTGGGEFDITAPIRLSGNVKDSAGSTGTSGYTLKTNGNGALTYGADLGCYTLQFCAGTLTTVNDNTTYYLGFVPGVALGSTPGRFRVYAPKAGTVKACELMSYASTAGSDENWTWALLINNTTSANVQTVGTSATLRRWTNTSMNTAVAAGDYLEFVTTTPTWVAANPASLSMMGTVYIETTL